MEGNKTSGFKEMTMQELVQLVNTQEGDFLLRVAPGEEREKNGEGKTVPA